MKVKTFVVTQIYVLGFLSQDEGKVTLSKRAEVKKKNEDRENMGSMENGTQRRGEVINTWDASLKSSQSTKTKTEE